MQVIRKIDNPIAGEHVLQVEPPLAPYTDLGGTTLRRSRGNFFTHRTLTDLALTAEQHARMSDLAAIGQALAPGVITGLEVDIERRATAADDTLVMMPGRALAFSGEDVELSYTLRVEVDQVPLDAAELVFTDADDDLRALAAAGRDITLGALRTSDRLARVPHAMVLTCVPISLAIDTTDTGDSPCPNAIGFGVVSDQAWEDGFQLRWAPWPNDQSLPPWSSDNTTLDVRFRNRLAYTIFNHERDRASLGDRIRALGQQRLAETDPDAQRAIDDQITALTARARSWPWEDLGVAVAMVGFDSDMRIAFVDRADVVRQGGGRRNRSALVPLAGDDVLWQARVTQSVGQLAEWVTGFDPATLSSQALADSFDWLPPAGILPRQMIDLISGRQTAFPANFDVQAQPVPIEMVDDLIQESASLAPINLSLRDQVQVLVPVPARYFDPDLLQLDVQINPLFDSEVERLEESRLNLVVHRDGLRRRFDILSKAVSGTFPSYAEDDPNALADETGALDAMAFTRVHRSTFNANSTGAHAFAGATASLVLAATDQLIVFVRWTVAPLRLQLVLTSDNAAKPVTVYWGDAKGAAAGAIAAGPLPDLNDQWMRLAVPVASLQLGGDKLTGVEYSVAAGSASGMVAWGYLGKLASAQETYWVSDALPPGAAETSATAWDWLEQDATVDDSDTALGVPIVNFVRSVSEVDQLVASYTNFRGGILMPELGAAPPTAGAARMPYPLDSGLGELIDRLEGRIGAANDHVEFGFLRARTDIFRVRQGVLGVEQAGRLQTSPSAAELVQRTDAPIATEKDFADYFAKARTNIVTLNSDSVELVRNPTGRVAAVATAKTSSFTSSNASLVGAIGGVTAAPSINLVTVQPKANFGAATLLNSIDAQVSNVGTSVSNTFASSLLRGDLAVPIKAITVQPSVNDVVGSSLIGATVDNITVGERLQTTPSIISYNTTTKAKTDFVLDGADILKASGIAIDDLPLSGFYQGTKEITTIKGLAGVDRSTLTEKDPITDQTADVHESEYFRRSLDAVDNMVRFLRQVEIRVEDYRSLQTDAKAARDRMVQALGEIENKINALDAQLGETRHDLGVTRALRDEEVQRVAALIQRRKDILTGQVPYLVFRRPRIAKTMIDLPVRSVEPAVVADIVPACLAGSHDSPPELEQMVSTLKDVPARWFVKIHPLITSFDRLDKLQSLVGVAQERIAKNQVQVVALDSGANTKTGIALNTVFLRQAGRVQQTLTKAQAVSATAVAGNWQQLAAVAHQLVAVGDFIRAPQVTKEATLAAAGELDGIGSVAACLYASFSSVPPATRLRWAELFSQFDAPADLRQLTALPGFGDEALGIGYIQWRQMQAMVDWLFARIEPEADAIGAINDLVRVALLLASHAPVKRIISARIKRSTPLLTDTRFDLDLDPAVARIGMQVLIHAPATNTVVARAVIEDIAPGNSVARISQVLVPMQSLDPTMKLQLQSGPALSTPAAAASDLKQATQSTAQATARARADSAAEMDTARQAARGGGALVKLLGGR